MMADADRAAVARSQGGDPVLRLYALGHLTEAQVRAALEIERLMRFGETGLAARVSPDRAGAGGRRPGAEMDALRHASAYRAWAEGDAERRALVEALVSGESLESLRRRHRCRWATALERVRAALDDYARLMRASTPAPTRPRSGCR